jgi:hypothetical protein
VKSLAFLFLLLSLECFLFLFIKRVIFENESDYTEKIQTLKESYFPKEEGSQESELLTEDTESTFEQSSDSMNIYTQAIARSIK